MELKARRTSCRKLTASFGVPNSLDTVTASFARLSWFSRRAKPEMKFLQHRQMTSSTGGSVVTSLLPHSRRWTIVGAVQGCICAYALQEHKGASMSADQPVKLYEEGILLEAGLPERAGELERQLVPQLPVI